MGTSIQVLELGIVSLGSALTVFSLVIYVGLNYTFKIRDLRFKKLDLGLPTLDVNKHKLKRIEV